MADLIPMLAAVAGQAGEEADENFNQTVLLLHGDGTNGAQNNTFLDSSTNNFTITRNGNTTQGTFSPFSLAEGEWGNYFDGSGDYLSISDSSAFNMGSGDFTCECWIYTTNASVTGPFLTTAQPTDYQGFFLGMASGNFLFFADDNGSTPWAASISGGTVVANTWTHVAGVRNGNVFTLYINGVSVGTTTQAITIGNSNNSIVIGGRTAVGGQYFPGYISNARVVKGTAVYTSTFTPSTTPLTAISNTSLLTCQSNRFVDNSTNAFAITRNGNVKVTPFSPFAPSAAYSPSVNGGSGYFDGSGDRLEIADNAALDLAGSDFCVEAWIYPTATPGASGGIIIQKLTTTYPAGYEFNFNLSSSRYAVFGFYTSSQFTLTGTTALPLNAWHHVAAVRSGSDFALFVNGVREATDTTAGSIQTTASSVYIGDYPAGGRPLTGNIANVRMVKGSSVYDPTQTTITVPTAPLTAITNTSLLCNFTNAGILDNTGKNNLETVGDAQIDTGTKKFGTGSMEFDGTGDYLVPSGDTNNFAFGTGDFTIEFWYYSNNTGVQQVVYDPRPSSTNGAYMSVYKQSGDVFAVYVSSAARITGTTSISASTWYHIAVCRSGTSTKLFVNGVQDGSTYTDSNNYLNPANRPIIGADGFTLGATPVNGFIDDLRITKGVARYTANFTAPTKAFPDL